MSYDTLMAVQVIDDIDRLPVRDIEPLRHIFPPGPLPAPGPERAFCGHVDTPIMLTVECSGRFCRVCREIADEEGIV
jgi:hypothetical protein